jgi:hypothetical protein
VSTDAQPFRVKYEGAIHGFYTASHVNLILCIVEYDWKHLQGFLEKQEIGYTEQYSQTG